MKSSVPLWQVICLCGIAALVVVSSILNLTRRVRSILQPWVISRVAADVPLILWVQSWEHRFLDYFFSVLSCFVSVPFYTGFLPLLFWTGHAKLARKITMLIAFCDYFGNAIKDLVSAPRPTCPPVRRVTATGVEKEHAMEYGLPSSHALNTLCMAGYLLYYALKDSIEIDVTTTLVGFFLVFSLVVIIGIARIYLGMHSVIDVVAGTIIGFAVLAFWLMVHEDVDNFIMHGKNVTAFCAALCFLLLFAYPAPEHPTPSFEYHTAFIGVMFGIVCGIQETYHIHHKDVGDMLSSQTTLLILIGRVLVGIPTIVFVKFCSKALSKVLLPVMCNTLGIPIRSSSYVPALKVSDSSNQESGHRQSGFLHKLASIVLSESYDVDTGIRFLQYAGLSWSVIIIVPPIYSLLRLL